MPHKVNPDRSVGETRSSERLFEPEGAPISIDTYAVAESVGGGALGRFGKAFGLGEDLPRGHDRPGATEVNKTQVGTYRDLPAFYEEVSFRPNRSEKTLPSPIKATKERIKLSTKRW